MHPPTIYYDNLSEYELQSDLLDKSTSDGDSSAVAGIVSFDDNKAGEAIDLPHARIENTPVGSNLELTKFLNRPVNIANYVWSVGGTSSLTLAPWQLFLNHPSIKKKIDNYYLLRANLKLKFVINASPFYYGCMMVSYNPLSSFKNPFIGSSGVAAVPLSQLPRVYLYPSASQGASMTIPFVYYRDWLDITSNIDVSNMGSLIFTVLETLRNANGASSDINIQVYAWMEDVQLSGATVGLSLQSGKDEYGKSAAGNKPTSLASVSINMDIPSKATATNIIKEMGQDVAHAMGFTNVPVIEPVHQFVPSPFPQMASTDIGTPLEKLTLDSKTELTIDPKIAGADFNDELTVSNICCRESYLTKFPWASSNVADTLLFSTRVTPLQLRTTSGTAQSIVNGTPTWLVSKMFTYWRGDMTFRFKVISSQYHRGRLRFSWDPNGNISTTSNSTTEVYTKIVDIADSTDITITVPYMQPYQWSRCGSGFTENFNVGSGSFTRQPFFDNGVLTVRVLTELTAPIDSADISILVFTSGTDKLEFAAPTDIDNGNRLSPFTIQSGKSVDELAYDNEDNHESCIGLDSYNRAYDNNLVYMGESVRSLRTLLRRPNTYIYVSYSGSTSSAQQTSLLRSLYNRFPCAPGFDPNGFMAATGPVSSLAKAYNAIPWNTISWLGQCFLGCRGSIVYHINPTEPIPTNQCSIARTPEEVAVTVPATDYIITRVFNSTSINNSSAIALFNTNGSCGLQLTNNRTKVGNSALIPFYSMYKFRNSSPQDAILGNVVDNSNFDTFYYERIVLPAGNNVTNGQQWTSYQHNMYVAAGTDFSFLFFLAVPTLFYYNAIPTIP